MYEYVLPRTLGDEAKPLFVVKPLNFATGHRTTPDLRQREKRKRTRWYSLFVRHHFPRVFVPRCSNSTMKKVDGPVKLKFCISAIYSKCKAWSNNCGKWLASN